MTRHSAHYIAGVASRAGFTGHAVTEAVAIALHVSQGDDAYDHIYSTDPLVQHRGLFALDVATFAPNDPHMLFDPRYSAEKLYQLYRVNHSKWPRPWSDTEALQAPLLNEVQYLIQSRTASKPLEPPSKLADMAYHQRYLNGR